jgi:peptidylprolyl isomerase
MRILSLAIVVVAICCLCSCEKADEDTAGVTTPSTPTNPAPPAPPPIPEPVETVAIPDEEELTTTDSGLQYKDVVEGTGASPKMGDTVVVHYQGVFKDHGTEFDSSYSRGKPAEFTLGGVIEAWNEGLQTMKEGGKRILVVPSALGYGDRGMPPTIPPNSDLVFEVELLEVK